MPLTKRVRVRARTPQKFNYGELFVKGEAIASDLSIEYLRMSKMGVKDGGHVELAPSTMNVRQVSTN
jgi:hypothetical protein